MLKLTPGSGPGGDAIGQPRIPKSSGTRSSAVQRITISNMISCLKELRATCASACHRSSSLEPGVPPGRTEAARAAISRFEFLDLVPRGLHHRGKYDLRNAIAARDAEIAQAVID